MIIDPQSPNERPITSNRASSYDLRAVFVEMKPGADSPDRSFSSSSSSFLTTRSDGTSPGTEKRRIAHKGTGTTTEIAKDLDAKKKAMTGPVRRP